ncbi:hypothetical protein C8T65DRAFT_730528 [Cerioporus squamosus]|nr:hypothetical protein C8T65DRAFT_730528 [Cerioporus squamosus]
MSWLNGLHEALIRGALAGDPTSPESGRRPIGISVLYPARVGALTTQYADGTTERAQVTLPACVVTLTMEHVRPIFPAERVPFTSTDSLHAANTQTPAQSTSAKGAPDVTHDNFGSYTSAPSDPHNNEPATELYESPHYAHQGHEVYGCNDASTYESYGGLPNGHAFGATPNNAMMPHGLESSASGSFSRGGADRVCDAVDYTTSSHAPTEYPLSTFEADTGEGGGPSDSQFQRFPDC